MADRGKISRIANQFRNGGGKPSGWLESSPQITASTEEAAQTGPHIKTEVTHHHIRYHLGGCTVTVTHDSARRIEALLY